MTKEEAFLAAQALHWYCVYYHEGQGSLLYRIQCMLNYYPSIMDSGPGEESLEIYNALENKLVDPEVLLSEIQKVFDKE